MRLIGFCTSCNKYRYVRVTPHGLASLAQGAVMGICAQCEQAEEERRKERYGQ